MTRALLAFFLMSGLAVLPANAQTPENKTVVNVNFGYQFSRHDFTNTNTFPLFGETGSFEVNPSIGQYGMADFGVRRSVWQQLGVGLEISTFSKTTNTSGTATLPDPLFFNRPNTVGIAASGLKHTEVGIHIPISWTVPVSEKIDLTFFAGPSFVLTTQDVIPSITVTSGVPTATPVSQSATAKGANFGVDATYMITTHIGAGIFLRDVVATAQLESVSNLKVGGAQGGIGLRFGF